MDIQTWARIGAEARLKQIDEERASILKTFPDLRDGEGPFPLGKRGGTDPIGVVKPEGKRKRGGWKMSAAQKRAVSARMKKYWAARRKAGG